MFLLFLYEQAYFLRLLDNSVIGNIKKNPIKQIPKLKLNLANLN